MSSLQELAGVAEAHRIAIEKAAKEVLIPALKRSFGEYFEKYPDVAGLRWSQYTPSWNDGEACTFGVGELQACDPESGDEIELESQAYKDLDALNDDFSSLGDFLESAFGDGYQVTVTRDGEFTVEEYGHD